MKEDETKFNYKINGEVVCFTEFFEYIYHEDDDFGLVEMLSNKKIIYITFFI
jgi:hypothetical protein